MSKEAFLEFVKKAKDINVLDFINNYSKQFPTTFGSKDSMAPQMLSIELTDKCNLECNYCYGEFKKRGKCFWNLEDLKSLFDTLSKEGAMILELTGGEPLLHPNFNEILLLALSKFRMINVLTNGILIKKELIEIVSQYKNRIAFQVSIDGCSEETNRIIRGVKNTYNKTLNAIKQLRDIGALYKVIYMSTEENMHEIPMICELFRKEGIKNLTISKATGFGRACDYKECIIKKDNDYFAEIMNKIKKKYVDILSKEHYNNSIAQLSIEKNCGVGWKLLSIAANGDFRSCTLLGDVGCMGNFYKQNISDILNSNKRDFYVNFFKKYDEEACNICIYKQYCTKCISRVYTANLQRLKDGLGLCEIAIRNKMDEYLDFQSTSTPKFSIE